MNLKIRPMLAGDKPALKRILRDTPEFKPVEVTIAEEVIDSHLKDPVKSGYYILIAVSGSEIAGYIESLISPGAGVLVKGSRKVGLEAVVEAVRKLR